MTAVERAQAPSHAEMPAETGPEHGTLAAMAIGALGVVYGDIGTSPLYTFKTAIEWAGGEATPEVALGILSLVVWTLIITTSLKYVAIVMRADNDGEGGILALMSLIGIKHGERAGVIAIGILGAALLYGAGARTLRPAVVGIRADRAVLPATAGHWADRTPVRPHHDALVRDDRRAGAARDHAPARRAARARSPLRPRLSVRSRAHGLPGIGRRVPLRHRRRSALRRHGPFRPTPDKVSLVRPGPSKLAAELCWPNCARGAWRSGRCQPLLHAMSGRVAAA